MLAEHLKAILADKVLISSRSGDLALKEPNVQRVDVSKLPSEAVVINLQRFGSLSGVRNGPWKQRCDYMLVFRVDETDRVLFVELKKTLNGNENKGFEQLRLSLPLLKYLDSVCKLHFGIEPDQLEPIVRYVLIGEQGSQRLDKQPVRAAQLQYSEQHKGITVNILVGSRFGLGRLWSG
jgi:hypothetical protein